jgi:hypothetical protein
MNRTTIVLLCVGALVIIGIVGLSLAPSDEVRRVGAAASALAPLATFATVLTAVVGWTAAARAAGDEARRTEREKRDVQNAAHRSQLRARLLRCWGIIDEAVGIKPYQPDVVEHFISEAERVYWDPPTFGAFSFREQELIRTLLDQMRVDNAIASETLADIKASSSEGKVPRREAFGVICESFTSALSALVRVFQLVFNDSATADLIFRRYNQTRERVDAGYAREHVAFTKEDVVGSLGEV